MKFALMYEIIIYLFFLQHPWVLPVLFNKFQLKTLKQSVIRIYLIDALGNYL